MVENKNKQAWNIFQKKELQNILPILIKLGFKLDKKQVHISGERYLMSEQKFVLSGKRISDNKRVIIKISNKPEGIKEIKREHDTRLVLHNLKFAYYTFFSPKELLFTHKNKYIISIISYVEEKQSFLSHSLKEQFFLALRAFETQEGAYATTYSHTKSINKIFRIKKTQDYLDSFEKFKKYSILHNQNNKNLAETFNSASKLLIARRNIINQYSGFLTHSDFVIHNLRIVDCDICLLDHTSLYFGNKYESWARFLNYMIIYNKPLESALTKYVKKNRDKDEYLTLRLMRAYKIGFLIKFYSSTLAKTEGKLHTLNKERITFWTRVLQVIIRDGSISEKIIHDYKQLRDKLRDKEEIQRQKILKQLP